MNFKIHCTSGKSIKSDLIHLSKVRKAMVEHLQANTTSSPLWQDYTVCPKKKL